MRNAFFRGRRTELIEKQLKNQAAIRGITEVGLSHKPWLQPLLVPVASLHVKMQGHAIHQECLLCLTNTA